MIIFQRWLYIVHNQLRSLYKICKDVWSALVLEFSINSAQLAEGTVDMHTDKNVTIGINNFDISLIMTLWEEKNDVLKKNKYTPCH